MIRTAWEVTVIAAAIACEVAADELAHVRPFVASAIRRAGDGAGDGLVGASWLLPEGRARRRLCALGFQVGEFACNVSRNVSGCGCDDDDAVGCLRDVENVLAAEDEIARCPCACHALLSG